MVEVIGGGAASRRKPSKRFDGTRRACQSGIEPGSKAISRLGCKPDAKDGHRPALEPAPQLIPGPSKALPKAPKSPKKRNYKPSYQKPNEIKGFRGFKFDLKYF